MTALRKWLAFRLWMWASRIDESEWHTTTLVDGEGKKVVDFVSYGQWTGSWSQPYDMTCDCDDEASL